MLLLDALSRVPVPRPPVWIMRQAGRYLPEYRALRERYGFREAVSNPKVAAEIALQPLGRFALDAAIIFQDIMTPLEGIGVQVDYDPGPRLAPMSLEEVAALPDLELARVSFVMETIRLVRAEAPADVAVIGFAGAPLTLLAYLLDGGGTRDFMAVRTALHRSPRLSVEALERMAQMTHAYLGAQIDAGADVVQLFDSWVGLLPRRHIARFALPAALHARESLRAPVIYYAPGTAHVLDLLPAAGADCYGVDWRLPLGEAWRQLGWERAIQGNLDPAVLRSEPARVRTAVQEVIEQAAGRPGHVFNLGRGIHPDTPPEHVAALVEAVRGE